MKIGLYTPGGLKKTTYFERTLTDLSRKHEIITDVRLSKTRYFVRRKKLASRLRNKCLCLSSLFDSLSCHMTIIFQQFYPAVKGPFFANAFQEITCTTDVFK